jgi:hypothetical protein
MKPGNDFGRSGLLLSTRCVLVSVLQLRRQNASGHGATHSPEPSARTARTETISAGSGWSCV